MEIVILDDGNIYFYTLKVKKLIFSFLEVNGRSIGTEWISSQRTVDPAMNRSPWLE